MGLYGMILNTYFTGLAGLVKLCKTSKRVLRSSARVLRRSCGGPCGGLAEVLRSFSQVLRRCLAELRKGLAEVLRRSCGGPCGGLAEFIETLRRPPQDFKLLHYVVIGPNPTKLAKNLGILRYTTFIFFRPKIAK